MVEAAAAYSGSTTAAPDISPLKACMKPAHGVGQQAPLQQEDSMPLPQALPGERVAPHSVSEADHGTGSGCNSGAC